MNENSHIKIWMRDDNIVELVFKEGSCVNKEDAMLIDKFLVENATSKNPILFDRTKNYEMSWDIQKMAMESIQGIAI